MEPEIQYSMQYYMHENGIDEIELQDSRPQEATPAETTGNNSDSPAKTYIKIVN
tara:strand:+ start:1351 stop:1512 length:162 start_codon:yes stop_codon:yes gene_type:complete